MEERVIVLAPVGRDATLTARVLASNDVPGQVCSDMRAAADEIRRGAGAFLVAAEALTDATIELLLGVLAEQPPWSDLPIIVVANAEASPSDSRNTLAHVARLGHVTLLDRPMRLIALVSAVHVALRARRRQYQSRDMLARLREGVDQRDRFLAMLGHELRNPLSAIVFAVRLLPTDLAAQAGRARAVVERQSAHLSRLVDELLDVSRITSGKITLHRSVVDLRDVLVRAVDAIRPTAAALTLDLQTPDTPVLVDVDPVRIEQVVTNLLTNAIKYTPPGGHVRVAAVGDSERASIVVEDDGVGLAPDMLPRVFDLFTQADRTLDRARGGLGVGLTVVRALVELHGGSVSAHSPGLDRGSRFEVHLAVAREEAPAAAARASTPPPVGVRHVLLVEDDDDIRESLRALLEGEGHRVDAARDGAGALARAVAATPDIAFIDIGLPGMDGYQVARALRGALGTQVVLAALTGYGQPDDRARALEAGFDAHLTKPVDIDRIQKLIRSAPAVTARARGP